MVDRSAHAHFRPFILFLCGLGALCGEAVFTVSAHAESFEAKLGRWFAEGKSRDIEKALVERVERDPRRPEPWLELASLRKSLGDYEGAVLAYRGYLKERKDWKVERSLALALLKKGEAEAAARDLERLRQDHPEDPDLLWGLAHASLRLAEGATDPPRHLADAVKWYEALILLKPDFALASWELAEACRKLGEGDKALEAYERALKHDRSYKLAHRHMAKILADKRRWRESLGKYERALSIEPDDPSLRKEIQYVKAMAPSVASRTQKERMQLWKDWVEPVETAVEPSPLTVRVGLVVGTRHLLFRSASDLKVLTPAGTPVTLLPTGSEYHAFHRRKGEAGFDRELWTLEDGKGNTLATFDNRVWIEPSIPEKTVALHAVPSNQGYFYGREEDRAYRGLVELNPRGGEGFQVINRVPLEAYTAGVLPAEMPTSWPMEALKAQAVMARTYALSRLGQHNKDGFDLCDSVHCQVYRGIRAENPRANEAVNGTAGWALKAGGKVVPAVFAAQCGGHSQSYKEAWGYDAPVVGVEDFDGKHNQDLEFPLSPYRMEEWIKGNPQAWCRAPELGGYGNFRWVWSMPAGEILKKAPQLGRIRNLQVTKRSQAGWAERLLIEGDKGRKEWKGDSIRSLLGGVRSNLIWIEPRYNVKGWPEEFVIFGGGWGHGVGMCQVGARGLAVVGKDYRAILKHYFPKADLSKLEQ